MKHVNVTHAVYLMKNLLYVPVIEVVKRVPLTWYGKVWENCSLLFIGTGDLLNELLRGEKKLHVKIEISMEILTDYHHKFKRYLFLEL